MGNPTYIATDTRNLLALQFTFGDRYPLIVHLDNVPPFCKLPDPANEWIDVKASDTILIDLGDGNGFQPRVVKEVVLWRCQPISWPLTVVESRRVWLEGKE